MAIMMKSLGPLHIMEIKSNQKTMAAREQVGQKLQNGTIADRFGANPNASSMYIFIDCRIRKTWMLQDHLIKEPQFPFHI